MIGFVYFLAWFMGGLVVLYGMSPVITQQPFVQAFIGGLPTTPDGRAIGYFGFVNFFWFFIIVPLLFWWYIIRPIPQHRGGFRQH